MDFQLIMLFILKYFLILLISLSVFLIPLLTLCCLLFRWSVQTFIKKKRKKNPNTICVGFFHPYCNAGGGGERVLWTAIKAIQLKYPYVDCYVYTGDTDVTQQQIEQNILKRFNIILPRQVNFVFLKKRKWLEASVYPYFTLLGQSLGSIYVGLEALLSFVPDIYIDSMGYAFTLPLFKYFGNCYIGCYVHYPTISTDMLDKVLQRSQTHNNKQVIAKNPILTFIKFWYYKIFAVLYRIAGRCSDIIMVNSSWTKNHINSIWKMKERTYLVYPACDIEQFQNIPINKEFAHKNILSIAQFRPEKDHPLQIRALHTLLIRLPEEERKNIKLILVGSCRNEEDTRRVDELRKLCLEFNVQQNVEFKLNVSFNELKMEMEKATIGIHTMWNEHFGIGIVECMAAGLIMVAHKSGGPMMDIIMKYNDELTGFLASDEESYAQCIEEILYMSDLDKLKIRNNAREWVKKFSNSAFETAFIHCLHQLFCKLKN